MWNIVLIFNFPGGGEWEGVLTPFKKTLDPCMGGLSSEWISVGIEFSTKFWLTECFDYLVKLLNICEKKRSPANIASVVK